MCLPSYRLGRYVDAVRAFERGIDAVGDTDTELALRIEAHAAAAARLDLDTCLLVSRRLERFDGAPPSMPAGGLLAGLLAIDRVLAGDPVPRVVALAERMLDDGRLPARPRRDRGTSPGRPCVRRAAAHRTRDT